MFSTKFCAFGRRGSSCELFSTSDPNRALFCYPTTQTPQATRGDGDGRSTTCVSCAIPFTMTWALLLALVALIGFLVFWIYHPQVNTFNWRLSCATLSLSQAHIVNNNGNRNWSFCGGSIVNNNWVGDPTEMAHQPVGGLAYAWCSCTQQLQ